MHPGSTQGSYMPDARSGSGQGSVSKPPLPRKGEPGWAEGLRRLYDSVVEEPLPPSFEDLLRKLDESDGKTGT